MLLKSFSHSATVASYTTISIFYRRGQALSH